MTPMHQTPAADITRVASVAVTLQADTRTSLGNGERWRRGTREVKVSVKGEGIVGAVNVGGLGSGERVVTRNDELWWDKAIIF